MIEVTEWDGDRTRLVRIINMPVGRVPPVPIHRRQIDAIYIHSGGHPYVGLSAVRDLTTFCVAPPLYDGKRHVGGGLGAAGCAFHVVIPAEPVVVDGRLVTYRTASGAICPVDGPEANGIRVWVAGDYASRHRPSDPTTTPRPSHAAASALADVVDYLLGLHGLSPSAVRGGFDAGRPSDPGDWIEQWIRKFRGESVPTPKDQASLGQRPDREMTMPVAERQAALRELGYVVEGGQPGQWGLWSQSALRAFQAEVGLVADGVWGPTSERALRAAVDQKGRARE